MSDLAIVAIPAQDDYVWKISSEKVPHLTLMMLGDNENPEAGNIEEFLNHVVQSSMYRFGLDVDHRGLLGEQDADVLFFRTSNYIAKNLEMIRHYLLTNQSIFKAYHSTEQFDGWTPHLTLGYPNSPAKKIDRDYPISWVSFDRIALWTGDYEGPEFLLRDQWEYTQPMAMSDEDPYSLTHYGVKGMKWGVRTKNHGIIDMTNVGKAGFQAVKTRRAPDQTKKTYSQKVSKSGGLHKVNEKELDAMIKRMELEKKFSRFMNEEAERRKEGRKAALKLLGEVGKVALPIALGVAANRYMNKNNGGSFRTNSFVSRPSITLSPKAITS